MNSKTIGIIVVIIIIVVGLWLMLKKPAAEPIPNATAPGSQTAQTTATSTPTEDPNVSGIKASGTSNASLNQDAAAIDAQLKGLATDNAAAQQ